MPAKVNQSQKVRLPSREETPLRRNIRGGFARFVFLLSFMVGVQATNANVHSPGMEPIEKPGSTFPQSSLHQHNFAEAIQVPHCPDQTLWQLSAPDFAEEETHHQSPRQNCQGEPSHMPDNWEPGDHIHLDVVSLMAAGNRHRLTPAPPVAVFDNPAATHDPEGVEFPDTTTEDSEDLRQ